MTDGYVVNNHGDRKSPIRVVGPFPNGRTSWLINGDDPNHLLTGMILQVMPYNAKAKKTSPFFHQSFVLHDFYFNNLGFL